MNEIRISVWNVLKPVLAVGMVVLSALACDSGSGGGSSKKSSDANLTALTVTIGGTDYPANIVGATATVTLPIGTAIPESVTVKSVTLSANATGLAVNDELTLTDGQATVTITAEDGATTKEYTLTVRGAVTAQLLPTGTDEYRVHAQAFVLSAAEEKEYRLAVKATGDPAPDAATLRGSSATLVRTLGPTAIKVIMSFTMDTDFFDADTNWDDAEYASAVQGATKAVKAEKVTPVLLQPSMEYSLYAVEKDGSDVYKLLDFTTDAVPQDAIWYGHFPGEHEFTIRQGEPFLLALSKAGGLVGVVSLEKDGNAIVTFSDTEDDNVGAPGGIPADYYFFSSVSGPSATFAMFSKALTPLAEFHMESGSTVNKYIHFVTQE